MTAFGVEIIREAHPMIVAKAQGELVERMDPGFWDAMWVEVLAGLDKTCPTTTLAHFVTFITYGVIVVKKERFFTESGVRYISSTIVRNTGLSFHLNPLYVPLDDKRNDPSRKPQRGDILFNRSGVGTLGRCTVFRYEPADWIISDNVTLIRVDRLDPCYVTVFLLSRSGQTQIQRLLHGVSGQTKISFDEIRSINVPLLPVGMQHHISVQYEQMSKYHDLAVDSMNEAKKAHEHGNKTAEKRYSAEYEDNIAMAEAILKDLIRQIEEIIEGTRTEIEPVDRVLQESQG